MSDEELESRLDEEPSEEPPAKPEAARRPDESAQPALCSHGIDVSPEPPNAPHIVRPPGALLFRVSAFVFSKRSFDRVLKPTLQDMQQEYFEALSKGQVKHARWIRIRGCWSFCSAIIAMIPTSLAKKLFELWKIS